KSGSGYIRLNANPSDTTTPYIDIVERTGSAIYDVSLKARLGDLSGLSIAQVGASPGFGLFSQNVFLTGTIKATSGSIGGIKMTDGTLYSGVGQYGNSNTPFYLHSSGNMSLKDTFTWDGTKLEISGDIIATHIRTTSGSIGGWTIGADSLTSTNIGLDSGGSAQILLGHATTYGSAKIGLKNDGSGKIANGNFSWDTSGNVTGAGTWTNTATITGGVFQTAASNKRIVIDSGDNTMRFHTAALSNVVVIDDSLITRQYSGSGYVAVSSSGMQITKYSDDDEEVYSKSTFYGGMGSILNQQGSFANTLELYSIGGNQRQYQIGLNLTVDDGYTDAGSTPGWKWTTGISIDMNRLEAPPTGGAAPFHNYYGPRTYGIQLSNDGGTSPAGYGTRGSSFYGMSIYNYEPYVSHSYGYYYYTGGSTSGRPLYDHGVYVDVAGKYNTVGVAGLCRNAATRGSFGIYGSATTEFPWYYNPNPIGRDVISSSFAGFFVGDVRIQSSSTYGEST
ncbi:MAG: hypothetical protein QF535_09725, partial [Anaerolineales bacterium]|nr:hypothetical protein [Anaerolineales bacterium]